MDIDQLLQEFNRVQQIRTPEYPDVSGLANARAKYARMLSEEVSEAISAANHSDLPNLAQELADIVYVCFGFASELGLPLSDVVQLVHENNLVKASPTAKGSKAKKSQSYQEGALRGRIVDLLRDRGWQPNKLP